MRLHLIKLCVGCASIAELDRYVTNKLKDKKRRRLPLEHVHTTRMVPKRASELLAGGSLYWVIRGEVGCRQRLRDVRPFTDAQGIARCRLVLEPKLILTQPRAHRAFQGWRYLEPNDAPQDLDRAGAGFAEMPEGLRRELRELGLL
jgi:hypothetical protein